MKIKSTNRTFINKHFEEVVEKEFNKSELHKLELIMKSDESSLIIINGGFGTGKSSLIKTYFKTVKPGYTKLKKEFHNNVLDIPLSISTLELPDNIDKENEISKYVLEQILVSISSCTFEHKKKSDCELKIDNVTVEVGNYILKLSAGLKMKEHQRAISMKIASELRSRKIRTLIIQDLDRYGCCLNVLYFIRQIITILKNQKYEIKFIIPIDATKYNISELAKISDCIIDIEPYLTYDNFVNRLLSCIGEKEISEEDKKKIETIINEITRKNDFIDGRIIARINNSYYSKRESNKFDIDALIESIKQSFQEFED